MKIDRLDHLVLTVANPDAAVGFYSQLGMRPETFGDGRLALRFGAQKINLHRSGAEIKPHAAAPLPGSADICLLIDGRLDNAVAELRALGVPIELGPVDRRGAEGPIRSVYLRDPDGNLVELAERARR